MGIEALKTMKDQLVSCVQGQLVDISKADAKQLGEAIDMIKDLSEAIYYCVITESMEKAEEEKKQGGGETNINYYTIPAYMENRRPMYSENRGYMYYPGGGSSGNSSSSSSGGGNSGGANYYTEIPGLQPRDPREGRSPMRRRMYMEGKETHQDPKSQLSELETYLKELDSDITEMIKDATQEEKTVLRQKMTSLVNKIS